MYLIGEEIRIETAEDRHIAHMAAIASDPTKASPLPGLETLGLPFTLQRASKDFIVQGLANIALVRHALLYATVSPELADEKLTELYGKIDSPEDFSSPSPKRERRGN